MLVPHRVFLVWLLYIVIVVFSIGALAYLDLPQIALYYDRSLLTSLLFIMYGIAEILAARQVWSISRENRIADRVIGWLKEHDLRHIKVRHNDIMLISNTAQFNVGPSVIGKHIATLCKIALSGQRQWRVRQEPILDDAADQVYERSLIGDFISTRIVWVGIFATILGVIMAFWPMIDGGSIDTMKNNIGQFFGGIAVAFIPTAVSFVCKIALDFNSRIIAGGVRDLFTKITITSEAVVIPFLDNDGHVTLNQ
jgi:hypothetical protein